MQDYFPLISDMSYLRLDPDIDPAALIANLPIWNDAPMSAAFARPGSYRLPLEGMRQLNLPVVNLGPYAFEELSFEIAVERCIPIWRRRYGCDVTIDADVDLKPAVAGDLFRITQEAVANACKHGEADDVSVTLTQDHKHVDLRITDNGCGFGDIDPLSYDDPGHIGLASMRERAEMLYGRLEIASRAGETVVHVRVPVPLDGGRERR